jgi:glycosyltransferase involved in cell wall biosynthesis
MSSSVYSVTPVTTLPVIGRHAHSTRRQIVVFDVLSHGRMHLQFNEAYLRLVRAAFPAYTVVFYAQAAHIENLAGRIADLSEIEMRPCAPFAVPFGLSHHSPVAGRWAARQAISNIVKLISSCSPLMVAILGVDANMYASFRRTWRARNTPLHLILHSQLGDSVLWRSRNPFIRAFDFVSVIDQPLPSAIRLVTLELGVKEAIAGVTSKPDRGVVTLEHPILRSEWRSELSPPSETLRVGFLGHSSRTKGFHLFAEMARKYRLPEKRFEAIGMWAPNTEALDLSGLDRLPERGGLPRAAYLNALAGVDVVCLPLAGRAYDFIASGSVSDAIAGQKPLIALQTRTFAAIWERYGPIGYLARSEEELDAYVSTMSKLGLQRDRQIWAKNLSQLRYARLPESLAKNYRPLVEAAEVSC